MIEIIFFSYVFVVLTVSITFLGLGCIGCFFMLFAEHFGEYRIVQYPTKWIVHLLSPITLVLGYICKGLATILIDLRDLSNNDVVQVLTLIICAPIIYVNLVLGFVVWFLLVGPLDLIIEHGKKSPLFKLSEPHIDKTIAVVVSY